MGAARDAVAQGGFDNEQHSLLAVAQGDDAVADLALLAEFLDAVLEVFEVGLGPLHALDGADDAVVIPHDGLDGHQVLPDQGRIEFFLGIRIFPGRDFGDDVRVPVIADRCQDILGSLDALQAEAQVKNNEDQLKMILNLSSEEEKAFTSILPKDKPKSQETKMALDEALVTAMENRPELRASRIGLKNQELNLTYARNQLLPGLSLTASYWSPGVSGEQIIYLNNNPLTGVIIGRIPGGSSAAMKDAFNFKYQNWSVGLTLTLPLNNFLSRAMYAQAKLNMEQSLLNLKSQEQQIFLEIKNAVRAVETNYKRVQAYRVARELADQKLAAEEEKLKVGLSTNYMVLQYQRDLSTARSTELRAIVDYNLSAAALDRALGLSLKNKDMKVSDFARTN